MSDDSTIKNSEVDEPSAESLAEVPEIDLTKARIVGRGVYAKRYGSDAHLVVIDPELWPYFGDAQAINAGLRALVEASKRVRRTG